MRASLRQPAHDSAVHQPRTGASMQQLRADSYIGHCQGGSLPVLLSTTDGGLFVVKFMHNPQGNRTPANG